MEAEPGLRTMEGVVHRTQRAPLDEKHASTFLYDRQQLPAQCEVEVGGDYYYIGPQRAGPPDRYES